ncbi:MAG TPA: glycosyltransferase [Arachnia sp.]|nr:glycosyltransferase [Propionibacteriaceae bacterium]HOA27991.1 glycosyltransferase [Arachnia sp.]HQD23132.1 glycosyltransferase [Arachnia sp.]
MSRARATGRVAHLSTLHPPRDNRIFNKECASLAREGVDLWFIGAQDGDGVDQGVNTVGIGKANGVFQRLVTAQLKAWRALRRVRPDLVHVHDPELIPMVWLWKTLHRKAAVYDAHEDLVGQMDDKSYIPRPLHPLAMAYARLLVRWADKGFDGIVTSTPHIRTLYRNPNAAVVHNYPYLRDYPPASSTPVPGRLVYVGLLSQGRQVDVMIDAVKRVPGARLLVAGPADADIAPLLEGDDQIEYLGMLPSTEVPGVVATGSVGLVFLKPLNNYVDSIPTKLFEYLAAGIPAVVSDFPWLRRLLRGHDCCVFVDTTTADAPAEAIRQLLADPAAAAEMGARGRRAIEDEFNFEAEVPALLAVTRRALDRVTGESP